MEELFVETKVESLEGNKVKVTVTVDAADIDGRIKKTYKDFARKYNFPGFRKGKAPRPVIDNALGAEAVVGTVTEELLNGTWTAAIDEAKLAPVGGPVMETNEIVKAGEPYEYSFTIELRPELTSYEPVAIEMPFAEATDAEIDEQVEAMAEHYTDYEDASAATKVKEDSYIDLAMKATDDKGEEIPSLTTESRPYGLGANLFPAEFDEQLVGLKKGQSAAFTLDMPADPPIMLSALSGKTDKIAFEVEVKAVKKKILPEVTDEWAKEKMGFESVEDMRERIKESLNAQKGSLMPRIKENNIMVELRDRVEGDVPESLVEQAETSLLQDFFGQLQQAGMTFDAYLASQNITPDQFKADLKAQSADQVKEELALEAWARHNNMEITDADVTAEFAKTGVEDPAALEQEWRDAGRLHLIRTGLLRQKAIEDLMENANVTEVDFAAKAAEEKKAAKKALKEGPQKEFVKKLASYADCYINDAFGTAHRAHASTALIADYFPNDKMFGYVMENELKAIDGIMLNPERPFCAILGGSKVSTKITIIENLLEKVDVLVLGGGMTYTFAAAEGGKVGNSICEPDQFQTALDILAKAKEKGVKVVMSPDALIADAFSADANTNVAPANNIPDGWEGVDIADEGKKVFREEILKCKTILWNGPVGVFEIDKFATGSRAVAEAIAEATSKGAYSLIGGGDSVACINKFGLADKVSYVSTGGGALLEYMEGKELPGVAAIRK